MIRARVRQGRVEPQEPIPEEWEGQSVKIVPLTPDDPLPDLEERLAALQTLVGRQSRIDGLGRNSVS